MSPGRKPMEQKTRYDLALDHLAHHFERNTLPLAPPLGELPADLVKIREGTGSGKQHCAVCESLISGAQHVARTAAHAGRVRLPVRADRELSRRLSRGVVE
jgi:hypothetical protein